MDITTSARPPLMRVDGGRQSPAKRLIDVLLAGLGLLVALPLIAVIAMAIKADDGGPLLFRQVRVGRDGRLFTIFKFRSMVIEADDLKPDLALRSDGARHLFKMTDDPRVTRVGRLLRRYSLDELPQLVNVLAGSMSMVGPRPHLPAEVATMRHAERRSRVRPGLTGLWQVSGRSDLDERQSVRLDLRYVDEWSLRLDAAILWDTIPAVLTARGAH
jgi:lipopolysaccharide/colanic/teichoic acid biosynthesis glycosyltransferase